MKAGRSLRSWWRARLSVRLVAAVLGLTAVSAVAFTIERHQSERSHLEEQIREVGTSLVQTLALACPDVVVVEDVDYALLETYANELVRQPGVPVAFVTIEKANGKVLATAGRPRAADAAVRTFEAPIVMRPSGRHLGTCRVGVRVERWQRLLAERWQHLTAELLGAAVVVAALLLVMLRWMIGRPLRHLDEQARRIGAGDLSQPIALRSEDELGRLAQTLEDMRRNLDRSHRALAEQNTRLQEVDRLKNEFLANISHEMRTPLTAIVGNIELLGARTGRDGEEMAALRRNTDALLCTVNQILDLSKLQGGQLHVEPRPVRIQPLLRDTIQGLRPQATDKGLDLRLVLANQLPEWLVTDGLRLQQILRIVIDNAIKFSHEGTIEVTAVVNTEAAARLVISVADHGPGMTAEQLSRLFQPFDPGDASLTRRHGGAGIGLAIARAMTRALDGELELSSVVGSGTTVRIAVAAGDLSAIAAAQQRAEATAGRASILLVDDAPDNRRLLAAMLRKAGHDVCMAENGAIACELEQRQRSLQHPFDIVLMDIQMPVMDGCEAARKMRADGRRQPILALTAHATAGDRQRCLDAGFDDYATKPIGREQLCALVQQHRDGASAACSAT